MNKKIENLKDLAKSSIFFPFTEPTIKSPSTGKKVSGDYDREFYNKKIKTIIGR